MTAKETDLESILYFLDAELGIPDFPDYESALNGLQVEGRGPVRMIGAAVDASVRTIEEAISREVDLLIVHHGLYWSGLQPLTGRRYRRIEPLIRSGTALYSAHLPLDAHPKYGNAAELVRALGLSPEERFGTYAGVEIGFATQTDESREAFKARVEALLGGDVRMIEGGPAQVERIGVVTGSGSSFLRSAAEKGLDTLLTGEAPHHSYLDAMELGVNLVLGGHYATETFGVKALAVAIEEHFGTPWHFIDAPTGM